MTRAVNDATLQKAGDIYQYLIALRDCFELNDGDTLQIETNGDVSIINDVGGRLSERSKTSFWEYIYFGQRYRFLEDTCKLVCRL